MNQKKYLQAKKEIIFLFITTFLSITLFSQINTKKLLITSQSIGNIKLLQNISELKKNKLWTIKKILTQDEGEETPSYKIIENSATIFELSPEYDEKKQKFTDQVIEIKTTSNKFKTTSNIGVQSTISDFIKAYTQYKLWYTYVSNRFIIETPLLPNVQFEIDAQGFKGSKSKLGKTDTDILKLNDFTTTTKIISVRVF